MTAIVKKTVIFSLKISVLSRKFKKLFKLS